MTILIDGDITNLKYIKITGNKYEHRFIVEKSLKRPLKSTEIIHHLDYNKRNNIPTNLVVCPNDAYHFLLHARTNCLNDGYHPDIYHYCTFHKQYEKRENFSTRKSWSGLHNMCKEATNEYKRLKGYNKDKFTWRAAMHQQVRRAVERKLASSLVKEGCRL